MTPFDSPRLLADVGSVLARFAVETAPGRFEHAATLRCAEHADFLAAVSAYMAGLPAGAAAPVLHAAVAIGEPVDGDAVRMARHGWQFSIEQVRRRLALATLEVVNDYTALAMALPRLTARQRRQVGGGVPRQNAVMGLLGPGSGLGVSGLIPLAADTGGLTHVALGAEGGHASFSPRDEREIAVLRHALTEHAHVSFERLLSGPGIALIHRALCLRRGGAVEPLRAEEITGRALDGSDPACSETLEVFCAILGTAAANLAVTLGALGGVYIGGGIVPQLGDFLDRSPFRARFEDKGRFGAYLRAIPTYVVTDAQATFIGLSALLSAQLREPHAGHGSALLAQVQRARDTLSPAERRVADHVLAHPRAALSGPVAEIARASQVSQPTVIRFCRSLGCEGLSDFRLRLASGLSGTVPLTHAQVRQGDSALELGVKVLGNTASAILQLREQLNREHLVRAIELLAVARRIDFFAIGHDGMVADDAQLKFLRFGVPSSSHTDTRVQPLAAKVLAAQDVAVLISSSGRSDELLAVAELARQRGAAVLALAAGQSPLVRKADVALIVDHAEDPATQVPMVSRILHLLVIDILAVGMAMKLGAAELAVAEGGELARLSSHSR